MAEKQTIDALKVFDYVEDFFNNNPKEYEKVKGILKLVIAKLSQDALNHNTFCDLFATPNSLPEMILKIIGISHNQLSEAFFSAGFFRGNAMHADNYYHILLLLYFIGLKKDDQILRLYSITLIYVKLYNGRKTKYFPHGCIPEVASYIVNNMLRASHTFKRFKTPFHLVVEYWAPSLDQTYAQRIRQTPFDSREGLVKILAQAWARVDQTFMGVQEHYYAAHAAGLKDTQFSNNVGDNSMQEKIEISEQVVERLADKINRTLLVKKFQIDSYNVSLIIRALILPQQYLNNIEEYLNNYDEEDEGSGFQSVYEEILKIFNIKDESDICNINISQYTIKIMGNQSDQRIIEFRQLIDQMCKNIFKQVYNSQGYNQQQKIKKMAITILLFRIKAIICKDIKYDGI